MLMMMEEDDHNSRFLDWEFDGGDGCDDHIDLGELCDMLDEKADPLQINQDEDSSVRKSPIDDSSPDSFQFNSEFQEMEGEFHSEVLDARPTPVGGSVDYHEKLEDSAQNGPPVHNSSVSLDHWLPVNQGTFHGMPSCRAYSFAEGDFKPFLDHSGNSNFDTPGSGTESQFLHVAENLESRDGLDSTVVEAADVKSGTFNVFNAPEISDYTDSTFCHGSDIIDGINDSYLALPVGSSLEAPMFDLYDVKGRHSECEGSNHVSLVSGNFFDDYDNFLVDDKGLVQPFHHTQSCILSKKHLDEVDCRKSTNRTGDICSVNGDSKQSLFSISPFINGKDEKNDILSDSKRVYPYQDPIVANCSSLSSSGGEYLNLTSLEIGLPGTHRLINQMSVGLAKMIPDSLSSSCGGPLNLTTLEKGFSSTCSEMMQLGYINEGKESKLMNQVVMDPSKVSPESNHSSLSDCRSHEDDGPDLYILEDFSQPASSNQSTLPGKKRTTSQHSVSSGPKAIFRCAIQDLSQPKSEASPPDGVLAVPLLRHQRIALSWMIQKETANELCSGGILADDQGLGKTISTIALILKERPPSLKACPDNVKKVEPETVNLVDDDEATGIEGMNQESGNCHVKSSGCLRRSSLPLEGQAKGRPAAGTLVVCPTSVLRQWADELQNRVTNKANLSVLVYHGSNRTKDPSELAKYDVVLTTYSIVSMEVPKQPSVDEDDDEKCYEDGDGFPASVFKSSKKRKFKPTYDKKGTKHQKRGDGSLLESVSGPLAKVGWFRVILDEAQSIKNHRTQVARACWGLRAKRRWCLSGTPIQNAIDDLYSYFRFLRYDTLSAYKSFQAAIKSPITKNPARGYLKLQTILKTIMLRRTKGTILDGEPIITLPPKVVELRKVDFTEEERDFYSRLEIASRAQFKEYAAAGTVKQNYVNILLMLLRLRQACDHPLLVKGFDSNSLSRSSAETAKKLPREKLTSLLSGLEASLALCGICNDPPEDAVVAVCGHVFCYQCISEHLTGDDSQCPTVKCKVRLSMATVFSKATLNSSLSEQSGENSSASEVESVKPYFDGKLHDSSKIKAALEVLQSLTKPQGHTSRISGCFENHCHLQSGDSQDGLPDKQNVVVDKSSDDPKIIGEKAIVFSQWTRMLDLFEACLKSSSIQYRRLDGTMSVAARDKAVKDFNTLPEVTVMIMSLKAASLGLNMVAACRVLLLDLWWNPTTEDQAIDRAHRIGQTRPVTVLRLTVKDTVEDRILALQQKKREMVASAFGEDETGSRQTRLTVEDLEYLFMA
ncbi:hypothetical protein SLE2022_013120 [Rubroshorea leprosula]